MFGEGVFKDASTESFITSNPKSLRRLCVSIFNYRGPKAGSAAEGSLSPLT